MEQGNSCFTS